MREAASYIMDEVKEALNGVDQETFDAFVDALISAKKIFIYGVGRSGLVGKAFSVRLVQMGLATYFIGDTTTPIVESGDVVLIISNTGETMSAVQTANIVGRLGSKVILITGAGHSKLGSASSIIVELKVRKDEHKGRFAPLGTLFEAAAYFFLDSTVPVMMERLQQTEASMRRRHAIWV